MPNAIREGLAAHPLLAEGEARTAASQGLRRQAELKPNPRLYFQSENNRFWGTPQLSYGTDTDNFAYVSQLFESGGKRERRIEVADAIVRRTELERRVTARQIASRISLAYWSAAAAEQLSDLLKQDLANFDQVVDYHRARVREGAMAEVDLLRVLLEHDRLTASLRNSVQDAARAKMILLREMGRREFGDLTLTTALTELRDISPPDVPAAVAARPETRAVQQLLEQSRANLRLQQALAKPDPELLFGYKQTSGFATVLGGLQINLPVRSRNQGAIASASADIRIAEAQQALTERQIRSEIATAYSDYLSKKHLIMETLAPMRSRADEVARIALGAYREGGTDLLRLLDAQRTRIETLVMYHRALADYQQSVTALQIATGGPL